MRYSGAVLPIVLCCAAGQVQAQEPVPIDQTASVQEEGEIVVTAQRREQRLQDVPIAVSVLSSDALQERRVTTALDLNNIAPSLRITTADAAANPKIFIRGVGLNDFNPTSSAGVGIYVDQLYVASPLAQIASFFDLERVEVLRGPQGTLYGRNTTGGAVNVVARRPSSTLTADGSVEYGRFDAITLAGGAGGPILPDLLSFRIAGQLVRDDGYSTNVTTGNRVNDANRWAVRASLRLTPRDDHDLLISATKFRNRGGATQAKHRALLPDGPGSAGPDGLCAPTLYRSGRCTDAIGFVDTDANPYRVRSETEAEDRVDLTTASLTYEGSLGAGLRVTSVTGWQDAERSAVENTDASDRQLLEATYVNTQETFTQEVRLAYDMPGLNAILGGFYMNDRVTSASEFDILRELRPLFTTPLNPTGASFENLVVRIGYPYTQRTDSYAVFGQVDYNIAPALTLTAGLRYSKDDKSIDYRRFAEGSILLLDLQRRKSFSDVSGRIALRYDVSDRINFYASYNRGYKGGGFFGGNIETAEQLDPYDNETVDAFEIGSKGSFLGGLVRYAASAFYYDYQDIQAYSLVERGGLTVQVLDNAATAEIYGAELELDIRPARGLQLSGALGLLSARYGRYESFGQDYSGNRMPQAPSVTFQGTARYEIPLGKAGTLVPRLDVNYRSKVFFDSSQRERISDPALWLVDGELGLRLPGGGLEVGIWGRNITDQAYLMAISPIDSLGLDLLTYARPASYGVFARARF